MEDKNKSNDEELLKKIKELREKTNPENAGNYSDTHTSKSVKKKNKLSTFFSSLFSNFLSPISKPITWLFTRIKRLINWLAYMDDGRGYKQFSSKQLIKRSLFLLIGILMIHVLLSAIYFYSTQFEEIVYTTGKQEIVSGEEYQFTGCTSLPCSTTIDNGKYYKISSSLYFPYLIYPEENVYANIPLQDGACQVKGYGIYFRRARFFVKQFQWWQKAYSVQCRPYTEDEKNRAINSGEINSG